MVNYCCVPKCQSKGKNLKVQMHRFPNDEELFKVWIDNIRRHDINMKNKASYRVCHHHFSDDQICGGPTSKTTLRRGAIPNVFFAEQECEQQQEIVVQYNYNNRELVNPSSDEVPKAHVTNGIVLQPTVAGEEYVQHLQIMIEPNYCNGEEECEQLQIMAEHDYCHITSLQNNQLRTSPYNQNSNEVSETNIKFLTPTRENQSVFHQEGHFTRRDLRVHKSLLQEVNVAVSTELTPKARKLYKIAEKLKKVAKRLDQENVSCKKKVKKALNFLESDEFLSTRLNRRSLIFLKSQIKLQNRSSKGRRFTLDDKIFSLSILQQGPKVYKLLQKTFALPSRKTLLNLLSNIPFEAGINPAIFKALEGAIKKMDPLDRNCCVMFDEMTLETSLTYTTKKDRIIGLENCGNSMKVQFADHAMVFMAKGIRKRWKQPIAFYFSEGGMTSASVAKNLEDVIRALQNIGIRVVATVCDQFASNTAAINILKAKTNRLLLRQGLENNMFGFVICKEGEKILQEIIPLYDVPHLLKGMRNNFIGNSVKYTWEGEQKLGKWNDLVKLYECDGGDNEDDTRCLNKLTDEHIYVEKMKKMKVKMAAQLFSHKVGSTMRLLHNHGNCLPVTAGDTAHFVLFMDKLFDSCNGAGKFPDHGKKLRCAISGKSEHVQFYYESIQILESMVFVRGNNKAFVPPTIKNWVKTLKGMIYLWKNVNTLGLNYLCPRDLNQDPIENFFGNIRSHGRRRVNPSCASFTSSFKTLIINNFTSCHSPNYNCEEDISDGTLASLKEFVTLGSQQLHYEPPGCSSNKIENAQLKDIHKSNSFLKLETHKYIAGYLTKQIIKKVNNCPSCQNDVIASAIQTGDLIDIRNYGVKGLSRPSHTFTRLFTLSCKIAHYIIPNNCTKNKISLYLKEIVTNHLRHRFKFNCKEHDVFSIFLQLFCKIMIFQWVKLVNQVLQGVNTKGINDEIKKLARNKYLKSKCKKQKINTIKRLQL